MSRHVNTHRGLAVLAAVLAALLVSLVAWTGAASAAEPLAFDSPEQQARFDRLAEELRCLVCQNQSLADSDAILAQDLRNEIFVMLQQGHSDAEIKNFMVERYGDFVLYRPPVRSDTLLLWFAPLLLLTAGAVVLAVTIARRRVMLAEEALNEALDSRGDASRGDVPQADIGDREP